MQATEGHNQLMQMEELGTVGDVAFSCYITSKNHRADIPLCFEGDTASCITHDFWERSDTVMSSSIIEYEDCDFGRDHVEAATFKAPSAGVYALNFNAKFYIFDEELDQMDRWNKNDVWMLRAHLQMVKIPAEQSGDEEKAEVLDFSDPHDAVFSSDDAKSWTVMDWTRPETAVKLEGMFNLKKVVIVRSKNKVKGRLHRVTACEVTYQCSEPGTEKFSAL